MRRVFLLLLVAAPAVAAEPAPPPRILPDESSLPAALKASLCDYFEYVGGETGTTRGVVSNEEVRRFWFARVRAKRTGSYKLQYTVRPTPPLRVFDVRTASKADYYFRFVIAKPGTRRIFTPQESARSSYLTATVGDTLVIPVHADAGRTDYRFDPVEWEHLPDDGPAYDWDAEDWRHRTLDEDWPAVRVTAPAVLHTINSWRMYDPRGREDHTLHHLGAYLSFATPGTFNVAVRLSDEPAGEPGRQSLTARLIELGGESVRSRPFRVVPKERPLTVLLADFRHTAHIDGGGSDGMPGWIESGTVEVRVGESIVVDFGYIPTPVGDVPKQSGVVEALPFRDEPHYTPR